MSSAHIQRLPAEVINRIAAGEVVQRPSAALKELLENALDAGSTTVSVMALAGGLDVLQVSDDGSGVRYADLPLLCERYATSKLHCFEDLQSVASFGFRGEALASISYVARVLVTTRRRSSSGGDGAPPPSSSLSAHTSTPAAATEALPSEDERDGRLAWQCQYMDGALVGAPRPCAGNGGTTIRAEKMLYNAQVRRAALRPAEEWRRILDVVSRYALAFPSVSFSCQREGAMDGLVFPKGSTTLSNLRVLFGSKVVSHLQLVRHYDSDLLGDPRDPAVAGEGRREEARGTAEEPASVSDTLADARVFAEAAVAARATRALTGADGEGRFTLVGYTSDATLLSRKAFMALFVNGRLVESAALRRAVDAAYSAALTGGNRPTTVLLVTVPADRLDVNVHPTKQEVYLLDEDLIAAKVTELLRRALAEAAAARQMDVGMCLGKAATLALQSEVRQQQHQLQQQSQLGGLSSPSPSLLNGPVAPPSAAAAGAAGVSSPLVNSLLRLSSSSGGGGNGGGKAPAPAPCTVARVEPQRGALDRFLVRTPAAAAGSPCAVTEAVSRSEPAPDAPRADSPVQGPACSDGRSAMDSVLASVRAVVAPRATEACDAADIATVLPLPEVSSALSEEHVKASSSLPTAALAASGRAGGGEPARHTVEEADDASSDVEDADDVMREFKRSRREEPAPSAGSTSAAVAAATGARSGKGTAARWTEVAGAAAAAEEEEEEEEERPGASAPSGALVEVAELEDRVLTSVAAIVHSLQSRTNATAQALVDSLHFVGVVDADNFLAQSGSTLLLVDTLRVVREVVMQRVFLRWAQPSLRRPPQLRLATPQGTGLCLPVAITEALTFALLHDVGAAATLVARSLTAVSPLLPLLRDAARTALHAGTFRAGAAGASAIQAMSLPATAAASSTTGAAPCAADEALLHQIPALLFTQGNSSPAAMPQPTTACRHYVRRLARRLVRWRTMFAEYFAVELTADGHLTALPCGLHGTAWPPSLRAAPLFLWLLAETVPYPRAAASRAAAQESPRPALPPRPPSDSALPVQATSSMVERQPAPRRGRDETALFSSQKTDTEGASSDAADHAVSQTSLSDEIDDEVRCFTRIAHLIADVLFGLSIDQLLPPADGQELAESCHSIREGAATAPAECTTHADEACSEALAAAIQFGLLPCLKSHTLLLPPAAWLSDGTVQSVVSVETLYKVFERC